MVIRVKDPFATLLGLQHAMESVMGSDWFGGRTSGSGAFPLINVFNDGDDFVVVAELPGVKKEDLEIQVRGDTVRIQGKKTIAHPEERERPSPRACGRRVRSNGHAARRHRRGEGRRGLSRRRLDAAVAARRKREAADGHDQLTFGQKRETIMVSQEVTPRGKRELTQAEERTEAGKFFSPYTDIHETDRAVVVSMEVPGVDKNAIDIQLEKGVLTVKGTIDSAKYESLRPIYSEYNVGNFVRTFAVSTKIDGSGISATVADGVLTVELPKAKEALARRIAVS